MQAMRKSSRLTRGTILFIALIQIVLGIIFILSPATFPVLLGLPSAPTWTDWMFGMLGARALGFAYGMIIAQRDLPRHASWLISMIIVQAIDWIATILAVFAGKVTLAQVSTASFLPILFIAVLIGELARQRASAPFSEAR
ncbi:MAG: hypothetical protein ACLP8A_05795 [Methylovirgula sp.]